MNTRSRISLMFVLIGFISCLYLLYIELSSDRLVCVAKQLDTDSKQTVLVKDRTTQFSISGDKMKYESPYLTLKGSYRISDRYPHGFIRAYIDEQLVFLVNDKELDRKIFISFCIKQS
ncbi:hypothetical protein AB2B46_15260 [Kluyvera intermedia]|uniref:hypothetical protein n=1 Tax=Kluyvera intermedia TaxID=61648 RepID=UPI0034A1E527